MMERDTRTTIEAEEASEPARMTSLPTEIVNGIAAQRIPEFALRHSNDRRFREPYDYLFAAQYGPISRIA